MFDPRKLMDMVKNASEIQKNMSEKLKNQKVEGEAAGGMVKVAMNGHFEVLHIHLDESLLKEDKAFIEDVIKSSINDATAKLRTNLSDYIKSFASGLGM